MAIVLFSEAIDRDSTWVMKQLVKVFSIRSTMGESEALTTPTMRDKAQFDIDGAEQTASILAPGRVCVRDVQTGSLVSKWAREGPLNLPGDGFDVAHSEICAIRNSPNSYLLGMQWNMERVASLRHGRADDFLYGKYPPGHCHG
jgi:hypothetical protein